MYSYKSAAVVSVSEAEISVAGMENFPKEYFRVVTGMKKHAMHFRDRTESTQLLSFRIFFFFHIQISRAPPSWLIVTCTGGPYCFHTKSFCFETIGQSRQVTIIIQDGGFQEFQNQNKCF